MATILTCRTMQGASNLLQICWNEARGIMKRAVARGLVGEMPTSSVYLGVDENTIQDGNHHVPILTDLEGMNAKLMSVICAGQGYLHHESFRMATLFILGGMNMTPRQRHG